MSAKGKNAWYREYASLLPPHTFQSLWMEIVALNYFCTDTNYAHIHSIIKIYSEQNRRLKYVQCLDWCVSFSFSRSFFVSSVPGACFMGAECVGWMHITHSVILKCILKHVSHCFRIHRNKFHWKLAHSTSFSYVHFVYFVLAKFYGSQHSAVCVCACVWVFIAVDRF